MLYKYGFTKAVHWNGIPRLLALSRNYYMY